ncbi:phage tail tape measure protein [Pseudoprimorskyibacter insulae]|uniref:Uncharacterized protein n=1 Tax=Pseudoprimorskyibacter insulae TaxID=1695997 RepID=A0A2R8AXV3_9RHOB|nr:phage tail tape measure protein [Pseudoprimorskyibacter insulae]SPF80828.1 hypothetical protein PRI8871_02640 [Pseudoprimorskyibacter insulae]
MAEYEDLSAFEAQVDALETSLAGAAGMAAGFDAELRRVSSSLAVSDAGMARLERSMSRGLGKAIDGVVFEGMRLSDALKVVAQSMISASYKAAVKPVTDHFGTMIAEGVGSLFGGAFADGAAFSQGRVMPFANGGIVSGPTTFPMRGATGLMGEAGPEAIMPLARGPDGKLGVRSGTGASVNVVMNISTPDADSFRRSQSQIAAQMSRALAQGQRNR